MVSAFGRIGSSLSTITDAAPATGSGGQFTFSPDELRSIVADWKDLADDYQASMERARTLASIEGPGDEEASQAHAMQASYSGTLYLQSVQQKREYCLRQAAKFQAALDAYVGVDEEAERNVTNAGDPHRTSGPLTSGGI